MSGEWRSGVYPSIVPGVISHDSVSSWGSTQEYHGTEHSCLVDLSRNRAAALTSFLQRLNALVGTTLINSSLSLPVEIVRKWLPWEQSAEDVPLLCVGGGRGLEGMIYFHFNLPLNMLPFLFFVSAQNRDNALPLKIVTLWVGVSSQSFWKVLHWSCVHWNPVGSQSNNLTVEKKQARVVESVS